MWFIANITVKIKIRNPPSRLIFMKPKCSIYGQQPLKWVWSCQKKKGAAHPGSWEPLISWAAQTSVCRKSLFSSFAVAQFYFPELHPVRIICWAVRGLKWGLWKEFFSLLPDPWPSQATSRFCWLPLKDLFRGWVQIGKSKLGVKASTWQIHKFHYFPVSQPFLGADSENRGKSRVFCPGSEFCALSALRVRNLAVRQGAEKCWNTREGIPATFHPSDSPCSFPQVSWEELGSEPWKPNLFKPPKIGSLGMQGTKISMDCRAVPAPVWLSWVLAALTWASAL